MGPKGTVGPMRGDESWSAETVEFVTSDGEPLVGDLIAPTDVGDGTAITRAVAVCHPHPQYGGNRFNPVVEACCRALVEANVACLRFDFRAAFGDGVTEQLDLIAALDVLAGTFPGADLDVIGYSFGAMVALSVDDDRIGAKVLIAPPLGHLPVEPAATVPHLLLVPAHDQFAPPDTVRPIADRWADAGIDARVDVVEMTDHFLQGRTRRVADQATLWLTSR